MYILSIMFAMVLAGCLETIFAKLLDSQKVNSEVLSDDGTTKSFALIEFKHPILLNFFLFLGETFLFLALKIKLSNDPVARENHEKNKINPLWFAVPACLDAIDSCLNFMGLMLITASTFQILENLAVVYVVILSVILLGKRYACVQIIAVLSVLGGLLLVSQAEIEEEEVESEMAANPKSVAALGMILVTIGQMFHACHCIFEEHIL